jgi:hypothetical protein
MLGRGLRHIDDGFHQLGNFSYLRTRKGVKGYLREDNCSVGVAETLSLVGVQHIGWGALMFERIVH